MRLLVLLLAACAPSDPELLLEPDEDRDGLEGRDGPLGVARVTLGVQVRLRDARPADVVFPAEADGSMRAGPHPVVLFLHGGFVDRARYEPLAVHLASRGFAVLLPAHRLDLPILEPGNGDLALRRLRELADEDGPLHGVTSSGAATAVAGHSLGGVVAVDRWVADPGFDTLVLLASEPRPDADVTGEEGRPVLSLVGAEDERIAVDRVLDGAARFPGPTYAGVVDGMDHLAWLDPPDPALRVLDGFLDHVLVKRDPAPFGGDFPGVAGGAP